MNRFILSEEEKKEILSLHKKYISEQVTNTASTASNTASTVSNSANTQTSTVIAPGVYNEKVLELQNLLKTKHAAGIAADGKLGPKTLGAVENVLQGKPATPNVSTQNNVSTSSTTSGSTIPTTSGSTSASTTDLSSKINIDTPKQSNLNLEPGSDMIQVKGLDSGNSILNQIGINPNEFNRPQGVETD